VISIWMLCFPAREGPILAGTKLGYVKGSVKAHRLRGLESLDVVEWVCILHLA
jgi:hypothetical protein